MDKPRVGRFSIHDDISIKFMKRLNPDPEVLQIMEQGLRFTFTTDERSIPPYHEPNNKSCTDNIEVAVKKIQSWEERGFIVKVPKQPYICSPLSVAEKLQGVPQKILPCFGGL